jgi:hypothetical protein
MLFAQESLKSTLELVLAYSSSPIDKFMLELQLSLAHLGHHYPIDSVTFYGSVGSGASRVSSVSPVLCRHRALSIQILWYSLISGIN